MKTELSSINSNNFKGEYENEFKQIRRKDKLEGFKNFIPYLNLIHREV